jgi:ATP-dependent RNA helicase DDX19/DBP5
MLHLTDADDVGKLTDSVNLMRTQDEVSDDQTAGKSANLRLQESSHEVEVRLADPTASLFSATTFEALQLTPELLKGIYAMGYQKPSKIQGKALPLLMAKPFVILNEGMR